MVNYLDLKKEAFTVAIVGLGKMGMFFDHKLPFDQYALTHARAFSRHPKFKLIGAVDPNTQHLDEFMRAYVAPGFLNLENLLAKYTPDILAIAAPTREHHSNIQLALKHYSPRAIFCEKPISLDYFSANEINEACKEKKVPLFVNYPRRASLGVLEVKKRLDSGAIRGPFKGVVWYSKGLLHNGSHFVDLLMHWFGSVKEIRPISKQNTFFDGDALIDFELSFAGGSVIFCSANEDNFSHYTVEIVFSNGRLRIEQNTSVFWQGSEESSTKKGYRHLESNAARLDSGDDLYQLQVVDQLYKDLCAGEKVLCTGGQAVDIMYLLEGMIQRLKNEK